MIRMALADAAQRTGIAADSLQLVSAERVTWGDGSLGCPRPDMLYTQALVSGWRIRIRAAAEVLDYHAGSRSSRVVFCPAGQSQEPLPGGQTQVLRSRAQAAEAELDGALGAGTAALGALTLILPAAALPRAQVNSLKLADGADVGVEQREAA